VIEAARSRSNVRDGARWMVRAISFNAHECYESSGSIRPVRVPSHVHPCTCAKHGDGPRLAARLVSIIAAKPMALTIQRGTSRTFERERAASDHELRELLFMTGRRVRERGQARPSASSCARGSPMLLRIVDERVGIGARQDAEHVDRLAPGSRR